MTSAYTFEDTSRTLETPEGNLHYHDVGEGPVLLCLHGSGPGVSSWANFRENLGAFTQKFRCLLLDMPGFGGSDDVEGHPIMNAPGAVIRFLDGVGVDKANILGNSMGGGVAAKVASSHPERVNRVACIGGVGMSLFNASPAEGIKLLGEFVADPTREKIITWMKSMVYDQSLITDEFVDERFAQAIKKDGNQAIRKMYAPEALKMMGKMTSGSAAIARLEFLGKIQAPTLILWGRDDRVTPLDMALIPMRLIPKAELHTFHDSGHWSMIERKDEFESTVMGFFGRE